MLIFIIYAIVTIIFIFSILLFFTSVNKNVPDISVQVSFVSFLISLFTLLIFFLNTQIKTIYEGDWKEIYSNNIQADIEVSLLEGSTLKTYKPGTAFYHEKSWNNLQDDGYNGFITAYKNEVSEKKKIYLKRSNIKIKDEINKNSTITKIEYRKVKEKQIKLFNFKEKLGNIQDKYNGELRIEISSLNDNTKNELKNLFES